MLLLLHYNVLKVTLSIFILLIQCSLAVGNPIGIQEYCLRSHSDYFEATCLKQEVIVMNVAIYGRMNMGRCLEAERKYMMTLGNDPSFLGCSVNIMPFMDQRCSGRNRCEIRGADDELQSLNPCHELFKSYLEASYECVSVVEEDRTCTLRVTAEAQHLMFSRSTERSCGTRIQPWRLEAPEGQLISVNLLKFSQMKISGSCQSVGYLVEDRTAKNISICAENDNRISHIITSQSKSLQLILAEHPREEDYDGTSYLIQISAIGCSNVLPPVDAWLRRDGNTAIVGCYTSRQSWTLRCVDNHWIGVFGNCTSDIRIESSFEKTVNIVSVDSNSPTEVVVIITIITMGLVICVGIMCIGAVCWKRYNKQCKNHEIYHRKNSQLTHHGVKNNQALLSVS